MAVRRPGRRSSGAVSRATPTGAARLDAASSVPTNADLAELLALEVANAEGHLQRALRRASRVAFLWPDEASALLLCGRSLTELPAIGPALARRLRRWIEEPPRRPEPPPIRRGFLTLTEARAILAAYPMWERELRGDLQMHTTWSDGAGTVEEMAAAARERGYEYVAVTDHSKGLKIAGGMDEEELLAQGVEIERVNAELADAVAGLRVLRSIEMNLSPAGEGDMDPRALRRLDLVLGSFHSQLRKTEDQTPRYLAALRNPDVQVLGHPRGRIYNFRLGLAADWPRVFALAAELDKAVEIDAFPDRQDLDVELLELARASGVRISLGTDAHQPWQLVFVELGLAAALRAGMAADRILNFLPVEDVLRWVEEVRQRA